MIACSQKKVIISPVTLCTDMLQLDILAEIPTAPFSKGGCCWQRFNIISFHSVVSFYVFFCINIIPYSIGQSLYCSFKDQYNLSFHIVSFCLFHGIIKKLSQRRPMRSSHSSIESKGGSNSTTKLLLPLSKTSFFSSNFPCFKCLINLIISNLHVLSHT